MFAQKIRELRQSRGLSEAALDEIFDLMRGTVANWEHGFAVPDEELVEDIAAYFGIRQELRYRVQQFVGIALAENLVQKTGVDYLHRHGGTVSARAYDLIDIYIETSSVFDPEHRVKER